MRRRPGASGVSRAICWTPVWDKDRAGWGLEHLLLREGAANSVVLAFDAAGHSFRLAYQLTWDERWRLRDARLLVTAEHATRSLHLETNGEGRWRNGDGRANTFPIRRQPLAVGERQEFVMAWVSAPELTLRPMRQGYTRLAERRYLYENLEGSGFRAELTVDQDDVVLDYEGVFRRVG